MQLSDSEEDDEEEKRLSSTRSQSQSRSPLCVDNREGGDGIEESERSEDEEDGSDLSEGDRAKLAETKAWWLKKRWPSALNRGKESKWFLGGWVEEVVMGVALHLHIQPMDG